MKKIITFLCFFILISSCGIYRPTDAKKVPVNANERVKKNMEEGRGFRLGSLGGKGGDFMFASSNPMWRASMEKLSFAPLSVVDYGGGIIITDWISEQDTQQEEIKISVRFLTNEIRSDAIKIIVHKRTCSPVKNNCKTTQINNDTNKEIKFAILKRAAEIKNQDLAKTREETGEYKIPGKQF